jgi:hypothetical protein
MSHGFYSYNDGYIVQIDDNYSNFVVAASGAIGSGGALSVPAGSLGFVRPAGDGNIRLTNWSNGPSIPCISSSTGVYYYFIATPMFNLGASGDNHGLRIYRSDGSLAYDSGYSYPYPLQNISLPFDQSTWSYYPASSSNRSLYINVYALSESQLILQPGNENMGFVIGPVITFGSRYISATVDILGNGPPAESGPWGHPRSALIMEY